MHAHARVYVYVRIRIRVCACARFFSFASNSDQKLKDLKACNREIREQLHAALAAGACQLKCSSASTQIV